MKRAIAVSAVILVLGFAASGARAPESALFGQDRAAPDAATAPAKPATPAIDLQDAPFSRVIAEIGEALGVAFPAPPPQAGVVPTSFHTRPGPLSRLRAAFETLCEEKGLALVGIPGTAGCRWVAYSPPQEESTSEWLPPQPRLSVEVVEGIVELVGDRGSVRVRAGESAQVRVDGLPSVPMTIDPGRVAPWRTGPPRDPLPGPPPPPSVKASLSLPSLELRFLGLTSEGGKPIIEYSVSGSEQAIALGEAFSGAQIADIAPQKVVMADGMAEIEVPVRLRLHVKR